MPNINDALTIKYNGIDALRAVYNGVNVWEFDSAPTVPTVDYPIINSSETDLIWATYPALFEKDTLQQLPTKAGSVTRNANGYSAPVNSLLRYPSPNSNGLEDLRTSGAGTFFIKCKFSTLTQDDTWGLILLNSPWVLQDNLERVRVYITESGENSQLNIRWENASLWSLQSLSSIEVPLTTNTEYTIAVAVDNVEVRFFVNGTLLSTAGNSVTPFQSPRFVINPSSDIVGISLNHRGTSNNANSVAYSDLSFAAIFKAALSDTKIAEISADPTVLLA